jgi:Putative beta-lactamase-inhibitor-like, PepSY-like
MRTWITMGASLAIFFGISALEAQADEKEIPLDKVPQAVMKAVKAKFPKAVIKTATEETEDGKTEYEIETTVDGLATDIVLKPDGTIVVIEKEIKEKDLPVAVQTALKAKYPKAKIKKAEELTKGTEITYEMALEGADKVKEVVMDKTGKVIEEEKG